MLQFWPIQYGRLPKYSKNCWYCRADIVCITLSKSSSQWDNESAVHQNTMFTLKLHFKIAMKSRFYSKYLVQKWKLIWYNLSRNIFTYWAIYCACQKFGVSSKIEEKLCIEGTKKYMCFDCIWHLLMIYWYVLYENMQMNFMNRFMIYYIIYYSYITWQIICNILLLYIL